VGFLREGKEICIRHRVYYFSFNGFINLYYASFFDSGEKWANASPQRWCYLFCACFCRGP
jgi:hypothetical protein